MKKIILATLLAALTLPLFGQDSTSVNPYKNEFGIDVSGFVKYYSNIAGSTGYPINDYYFTYRRRFNPVNLRFGIAGDYSRLPIVPGSTTDSNKYWSNRSTIQMRIGVERVINLAKRWQVYYGLDFKYYYSKIKNDAQYWNGGYANGIESLTKTYAVAPILGFRFKMAKRFALSTETSYAMNWQMVTKRQYFIPTNKNYKPKEDIKSPDTKAVFTNYLPPLFLYLTFDF